MFFSQMPNHSKVWIYQANKLLSSQDVKHIEQKLTAFTESWLAHNQQVKGNYKIFHDRFVVIAADEQAQAVTGCSIDSSMKVIRELEENLNLSFTDRTTVAYLNTDNDLQTVALTDMKKAVTDGRITPETIIFNNGITTLAQLKSEWKIAADQSWAKRYFKTASTN